MAKDDKYKIFKPRAADMFALVFYFKKRGFNMKSIHRTLNKEVLNNTDCTIKFNSHELKNISKIKKHTRILFLKENIGLILISFTNIGIIDFKFLNIIEEICTCLVLSLLIGIISQIFSNSLVDNIFENIVHTNISIKKCVKSNILLNTLALIMVTWAIIVLKLFYITQIYTLSIQFIALPPIIAILTGILYYQITYLFISKVEDFTDK